MYIATSSDDMDCKHLESNSGGNAPMQIAMNNSVRATIVGCCFATEARLNEQDSGSLLTNRSLDGL